MKWENKNNRVPIKSWCQNVETGAQEQLNNIANLPVVHKQVAAMPDCHLGYGMPIGCVVGLDEHISPNMVRADIGCGMGFIETNVRYLDTVKKFRTHVRNVIERVIPCGREKHKEEQEASLFEMTDDLPQIVKDLIPNARFQLGTLGGGNHFIELQESDKGTLCIMIHSGSRKLGHDLGEHYNKLANDYILTQGLDELIKQEISYLPIDSEAGQDYIKAMNYSLLYAQENRHRMMEKVKSVLFNLLKKHTTISNFEIVSEVNIHHNYAVLENHFGKEVWLHRKGATAAKIGQPGIIPGSQGTSSYIVRGLGNLESFESCSHGAGRAMGRNDASRRLTLEDVEKAMQGIGHTKWSRFSYGKLKGKYDFGEAPQAYKNIDEVIESQSDLVEVVMKLRPLEVIKGE